MTKRISIALVAALFLAACADGPRDIALGVEECAHCRMLVTEEAFAAQLRSDLGRSYVFDAIECMAEFVQNREADDIGVSAMWVTDFVAPGNWVTAETATYLRSPGIRSPMGMNLSAFKDRSVAEEHQSEFGGDLLTWREVKALMSGGHTAGAGHVH